MALKPHIVHVVGYSEAHHAATADDVIASCKLARRAIENALVGQPDMTADPRVQARRTQLVAEAQVALQAIVALADSKNEDPLTTPGVLAKAVTQGILDAPQLRNNPFGRGRVNTRIVGGQCLAIDSTGNALSERERLDHLVMED
jgi:hypothetical protein